ncbi:hypothetical protein HIM_10968 [Hirsutella minnesotensis 3608]|uniref:Uncharacterized protein n=1 Tax=Hirsutella minnesotensis 3608 TaxID=1043627 RepID=A0A0F8A1Q4_9HYPO|nr:hypothetical protein HIM_10968 [Hirsutella minnesotensis 3608]
MDYLSTSNNASANDAQASVPRSSNYVEDVPALDFDSSTLSSGSTTTSSSGAAPSSRSTLNPQAPWFHLYSSPAMANMPLLENTFLPPYESPSQCGLTVNHDLKWMIIGMASRLDALELAVSTSNLRLGQIHEGLSELLKRPHEAQDMVREMDNLKKSLKDLFKSLICHFVGGEGFEDVDMESSRAG